MAVDNETATKFALNFLRIPKYRHEKTFMEITGYPHYENIISNILQFYFDTGNDHGMGNLMIKSLFEIKEITKDFDNSTDISVETEVRTLEGKRIDLIIESRKYLIVVENKINHALTNDLKIYSNAIGELADRTGKIPVKIVLSLKKLANQDDLVKLHESCFVNITYAQFLFNVEKNIGSYISGAKSLYLVYLTDFIKTIKNLTPETMANKALLNFINENRETAKEIADGFKAFKEDQYRQVEALKSAIVADENIVSDQWIYDGWKEGYNAYGLAHEMKFEGNNKISLDAFLYKDGWEVSLIARKGAQEFLKSKLFPKIELVNGRKVLPIENRAGIAEVALKIKSTIELLKPQIVKKTPE